MITVFYYMKADQKQYYNQNLIKKVEKAMVEFTLYLLCDLPYRHKEI